MRSYACNNAMADALVKSSFSPPNFLELQYCSGSGDIQQMSCPLNSVYAKTSLCSQGSCIGARVNCWVQKEGSGWKTACIEMPTDTARLGYA